MKKTITCLTVLALVLSAFICPVRALNIKKPDSVYVADYASVIDSDVEEYIIEKGEYL